MFSERFIITGIGVGVKSEPFVDLYSDASNSLASVKKIGIL